MKNYLMVVMSVVILTVSLSGCVEEPSGGGTETFEVHEWGVFVKGYNCENTSVLTQAPPLLYVMKPVIFFHSLDNATNITVEVDLIRNATTIPPATIEDDHLSWDVTVENNTIRVQNGTTYSYLFYEGEITCPSTIVANRTTDGNSTVYSITNAAEYTISTVFYIYGYLGDYMTSADDWLECTSFGELEPGETATVVNTSSENMYNRTETETILRDALSATGLTEAEVHDLLTYWESYWFSPTNTGSFARVMYVIPQDVYDALLPLEITPQPESITRVGIFTITME